MNARTRTPNPVPCSSLPDALCLYLERDFFLDNLLVRTHSIIVMMRWTGLALWGVEFSFQGSLTSTFLRRLNASAQIDLLRLHVHDKYSGFMKFDTRLDHVSHCKTISGTNWSNGWTDPVFIINTRLD